MIFFLAFLLATSSGALFAKAFQTLHKTRYMQSLVELAVSLACLAVATIVTSYSVIPVVLFVLAAALSEFQSVFVVRLWRNILALREGSKFNDEFVYCQRPKPFWFSKRLRCFGNGTIHDEVSGYVNCASCAEELDDQAEGLNTPE